MNVSSVIERCKYPPLPVIGTVIYLALSKQTHSHRASAIHRFTSLACKPANNLAREEEY